MPPRENPTARQARLGAELRKMREHAGKTSLEAAARIAVERARISNIESGRLGISEERIRRLATFYSCDDEPYLDALCAISWEHRGQFWWDEYREILAPSFLDLSELEHHATNLRSVQIVTIPGLLQTHDHARAVFSGATPKLPPNEVEARVEHRMRRKAIFGRDNPTPFEVIIHEAALRMRFGGADVARAQLDHLLECSERKNIAIHVIPFANETYIDTTHPVLYAEGTVPELDTVRVDSYQGGYFMDAAAELKTYRDAIRAAERASLNARKSRTLIHAIAKECA